MAGMLIAIEGVDQSGKETQAQRLRERLREAGHKVRLLSFPDYGTSIGEEIARALQGEREYGPDVMQLLFVANRHERREAILEWVAGGLILRVRSLPRIEHCLRRSTGAGRRLARRHPALSPARRSDDLHRHRSGDCRQAEGARSGSLRARSRAARPSASELSTPVRAGELGSYRWRTHEGSDCRRCVRGRHCSPDIRGLAATPSFLAVLAKARSKVHIFAAASSAEPSRWASTHPTPDAMSRCRSNRSNTSSCCIIGASGTV